MDLALTHRPLGRTGIPVSPLGLAGSFGVDADAVERAFHEHNLNYFFLSPRMQGVAEGIRRLVRAGHRDRIVIASGMNIPMGFRVQGAWSSVVKPLGIDYVDVFHLFWVQAHWYVTGKTWPALRRLKEEGKVRALAISCHDRKMGRSLVDELDLDVLMIRYNAAHRGAEGEIFSTLGEDRPGIVSYTATRWGGLLKQKGDLGPMTGPECYRFALGHPKVDIALCGAGNYSELRDNIEGVIAGPLPAERLSEVRRFGDAVRGSGAAARVSFGGV